MEIDFKDMYDCELDSDIKIVYSSAPITLHAHKIILRKGSGLLAKIMDGGMCETASGIISLTEHDPWAVQTIIQCMYGVYNTTSEYMFTLPEWRKLLYLANYLMVSDQLMKIIIAKRPRIVVQKFHKFVKIAYIMDLKKIWTAVCSMSVWDGDKLGKLPHEVFMQFHNKRLHSRGLSSDITLQMVLEYTAHNPNFNILQTLEGYEFHRLDYGTLSRVTKLSAVAKYPFIQSMMCSMTILKAYEPESDDDVRNSESEDD